MRYDWSIVRFIAVWLAVGWLAGAGLFALFGPPAVIPMAH
jgi:hypothetical protein